MGSEKGVVEPRQAQSLVRGGGFSNGERGVYAKRYAEGTNVVVLDPDVAAVFKTAAAVNDALRELMKKSVSGGS